MVLANSIFYIFSIVSIISALMVVLSRNSVHSVLFLILTFCHVAGLFLLLGAEFLAFLLIIVYVGAVAVLFLFVVMMIDINIARLKEGFLGYLPIGAVIGFVLLIELILVLYVPHFSQQKIPISGTMKISNTEAIGMVLYTDYMFLFQTTGAILLVAMIGAIILALEPSVNPKRQNINKQNARCKKTAIEIVKVKSGDGI